jgi:aryl-alcohol dehydrogenase-like predicted oxidoreductase
MWITNRNIATSDRHVSGEGHPPSGVATNPDAVHVRDFLFVRYSAPCRAPLRAHGTVRRSEHRREADVRLGFGGVGLGSAGGGRSVGTDVRLVEEAVDLGVTVFDTAAAYGYGASERILGDALRRRRDEVVLATKGGYVFRERSAPEQAARRLAASGLRRLRRPGAPGGGGGTGTAGAYRDHDLSPSHLRAAVEGSLRRLRTDHIDLYQLHGPPDVLPGVFDELVDLRTSGKVLAFGIGAESVASAAAWLAVPAVSCVQIPFGVLDPEATGQLFPLLADRPTDVWARGVLGGGLLALAGRGPEAVADDPKAPTIDALRRIGEDAGLGLDELAIAFVRSFSPPVSTMLVGITSQEHLHRNVALMAAPPPDDVVTLVRAVAASARKAPRAGA